MRATFLQRGSLLGAPGLWLPVVFPVKRVSRGSSYQTYKLYVKSVRITGQLIANLSLLTEAKSEFKVYLT